MAATKTLRDLAAEVRGLSQQPQNVSANVAAEHQRRIDLFRAEMMREREEARSAYQARLLEERAGSYETGILHRQVSMLIDRIVALESQLRDVRALVICEKHEDCRANPMLGRACAASPPSGGNEP